MTWAEPSTALAAGRQFGRTCSQCGARLHVLVEIEPKFTGSTVTYFACGQCAQVVIRDK